MAKKTTTFLLLNLFLVALSTLTAAAVSPAVFVFGDSTVDVGNNNFLPSDAPKVNFPPWGIDYPGRTPTGRFSNGFNYADYVAKWGITTLSSLPMAKKTTTFLLLILFLAALSTLTTAAVSPAVFVFGDSTVDVGNNNFLPSDAPKVNFPPWGIDFPGRTPTGRFSNGFTYADYIAKAVGLATSPPPFLSLSNGNQMLRGVNFASGGAGILYSSSGDVIAMATQIEDYKQVAANLTERLGKKSAVVFLDKSLFYLSVGSNDVLTLYSLLNPGNSTQKDEAVVLVLSKFKHQLERLYDLGARKFAVLGTGLLGCIPVVRVAVPSYGCYEDLNDFSLRFKTATKALLEELSMSLKGFQYSFGDSYEMVTKIFSHPQEYGFTELKAACCGGGRLNAESDCLPNSTYCGNRGQYAFWDLSHPSQALSKTITQLSLYGPPLFANPVNIHHLVKS
ncbi:GDSL-like Lipase/Acylhydrolase [Musa troglodytarum]|uniref:GDSL-like Lipase/Acylhydrolase n=1 Tax=Musa troglodytarum TaxID=320322 RepID=A0A9E7F867_9LILI|nr:GDSL-like Lipase/Acylhydrolase [Musa troglodytarum]